MQRSRVSNSSYVSPIKMSEFQKLEQDKRFILKKIHYLFVMYAAKSSRYAFKEIHEKSFMEMIADAFEVKGVKLVKNSDAWKKVVGIYYGKGKKTTMVYQSFLKILPGISQLFVKTDSSEESLKCLLKHLMMVYEDKVSRQIEQKYVEFDKTFSQETVDFLHKLQNDLYTVYKVYFPEEITNNSEMKNPNEQMLEVFDRVILFFKEFQLFPKIISASHLYLIFLEIATSEAENPFTWADELHRKRDRLSSFGFSRYLQLLLRVAVVSIQKLREVEDPEWWASHQKECVKALFEYMENIRTKVKNSRFKHVRFSFILYDEYKPEKWKWESLAMDPQLKPMASHGDFFDMFKKMKL